MTDEGLGKSSNNLERGAAEPACVALSKSAVFALKSFQIQSLNLSFAGSGCFELLANRSKLNESIISNDVSILKRLTLDTYDFSPDSRALQDHIDLSKLETLELTNCVHLGFLFNNMLCTYKDYHLRSLQICEDGPDFQHTGYFGKEKLERFLMLHTGLEKITLMNLGANRPCFQAISAQGPTLQNLTMHEFRHLVRPRSVYRYTFIAEDVRNLSKRCSRLQHLSVDLAARDLSSSSAISTALRQFDSLTHLEISLIPWDQMLVPDRTWGLRTFANVASPRLKRLDIYSDESYAESTIPQDTGQQNLGRHWRVDRMGKDVVAVG